MRRNACGDEDGGPIYRYNLNENRDLYSDLDRINLFAFINHDFGNGLESFTELSLYRSDTVTIRQGSATVDRGCQLHRRRCQLLQPVRPCRFAEPAAGQRDRHCIRAGRGVSTFVIDNHRVTVPRVVNVDGEVFGVSCRVCAVSSVTGTGNRPCHGRRRHGDDVTNNRVSNTLFQAGLNDPTAAAINLFNGGEWARTSSRRWSTSTATNETELTSVDFRMSQERPVRAAGRPGRCRSVAWNGARSRSSTTAIRASTARSSFIGQSTGATGFRYRVRRHELEPDARQQRQSRCASLPFAELQVPVFETSTCRLALRYEDFSDIGDTTVGKLARAGGRFQQLLFRGSWSEAFRVPNLITVNESGVASFEYIPMTMSFQFVDPDETLFDGTARVRYGVQRTAGGSSDLVPEKSTNTSVGVVLDVYEHLTLTLDYWSIDKDDTIGLFGEDNHTALDLLFRLRGGQFELRQRRGQPGRRSQRYVRHCPAEALALFDAAGICPAGDAQRVKDVYANLDTRKVKGHDIGVYFEYDTGIGNFDFRYVAAFLDKYDQVPGLKATQLIAAKEAGTLPDERQRRGFRRA